MTKVFTILATIAFGVSTAYATNLDTSVECSGAGTPNAITTGPGCTVNYVVMGMLDDAVNEGLALVGFDLEVVEPDGSGSPPQALVLPPATSPSSGVMLSFVKPSGLTNPDGYGGTQSSGKLLQCGGGQNTIMNGQLACLSNTDCPTNSTCTANLCSAVAPYPVGTVTTGIAKTQAEVLLSGSFTAPALDGTYELRLTNLFGNAVKMGETGVPFWATELLGTGVVTNLTVVVSSASACTSCGASIASSNPPINAIDAGQPYQIGDINQAPQGWSSVDITFTSTPLAAPVMADFTISSIDKLGAAGTPPSIAAVSPLAGNTTTLNFSTPIEPGHWTVITHSGGSKTCLGYLPGDANSSRGTNAQDITALINSLNSVVILPDYSTDVNRSGPPANPQDITGLINLLNGAGEFDPWNGETLFNTSPCD